MRQTKLLVMSVLILSVLLSSCSNPDPFSSSVTVPSTSSSTTLTEATFIVAPPLGTTNATEISLHVLDPIAGLRTQAYASSMKRRSDGRFETKLTVPVGSTLTYRFVRIAPSEAVEATLEFAPSNYRVTYIPGPSQIEETISAWSDEPQSASTGRIIGRIINAETENGQAELIVSAGGITTLTEADGVFRIDGLAEGSHHLTVVSPDGAFMPNAQGALIAAGATTPVELQVRPAKPVFVTFQLTVPEGLSPDAIIRIAGNLSTLGNRFSALSGGMQVSVEHMPKLVRIDAEHFLAVLSLYEGTDLHYRYTLGDGLWNAERNAEGSLLTRQVILPSEDITLRDSVTTWSNSNTLPVRFMVDVPENTPIGDQVSIQFKPDEWFEPLPMWPLSQVSWYYDLYGPLEDGIALQYRYCRNAQCGAADDADTSGYDAGGRTLDYGRKGQIINDDVLAWKWLEEQPPEATIVVEPTVPRPEMRTGVELVSQFKPSWQSSMVESLAYLRTLGTDSVIIPMEWTWQQQNPFPLLNADLAKTPLRNEVGDLLQKAQEQELELILKLIPTSAEQDARAWWERSVRDSSWWQIWFDEYHSFALTGAETAAELGIDALIMGGEWVSPALPEGVLHNGEPSGVPLDAEGRWRSLLDDIREIYPGLVVFELEANTGVPAMPAFLDSVDAALFHWQIPITPGSEGNIELMAQGFVPFFDLLDARTERFNRPLWLSIEYASVQGGAASCPPAPDGSCRPVALFEAGQDIDIDLAVSFRDQSDAINAVFLAMHQRPTIKGLFIRGFNPSAILWDKSASTYGKPAEDVLRYWYPRWGEE